MQKLIVLIVDDEQPARDKIVSFLKNESRIEKIIEAEDGFDAITKIKENSPSLIFLDIQMPGANGFEVIEAIGADEMPPVIFVTAFDQFAINAFEVNAIDYLLKPFDEERFQKSFSRAIKNIDTKKQNVDSLSKLLTDAGAINENLKRILVNKGSKYFFIKADDIFFISAEEKYIEIHTEKERYLLRHTMQAMEEKLDKQKFKRIHRSYIVNMDCIKEMQPYSHGDYIVILSNSEKIKMGRRYRAALFGEEERE